MCQEEGVRSLSALVCCLFTNMFGNGEPSRHSLAFNSDLTIKMFPFPFLLWLLPPPGHTSFMRDYTRHCSLDIMPLRFIASQLRPAPLCLCCDTTVGPSVLLIVSGLEFGSASGTWGCRAEGGERLFQGVLGGQGRRPPGSAVVRGLQKAALGQSTGRCASAVVFYVHRSLTSVLMPTFFS